ncbi:hypothetical protein LSAT2_000252, partial [Lamellibrachia satsuma]
NKLLCSTVPPGRPSIDAIEGPFVESADITLRCRCKVGKPVTTLFWSRQRGRHLGFRNMVGKSWSTLVHRHDDGTSYTVSELRVRLLAEDDGAVFRCLVKSGEDELFDDKKVSVLCE